MAAFWRYGFGCSDIAFIMEIPAFYFIRFYGMTSTMVYFSCRIFRFPLDWKSDSEEGVSTESRETWMRMQK